MTGASARRPTSLHCRRARLEQAQSAQSKPGVTARPASTLQKLKVPDVIGRSYADAGSALAKFKVDRIETASAAPAGEVARAGPRTWHPVPGEARSACKCRTARLPARQARPRTRCPLPRLHPRSAPVASAADPAPVSATNPAPPLSLPFNLQHAIDFRSRFRRTLRSFLALACCSVCCLAHC